MSKSGEPRAAGRNLRFFHPAGGRGMFTPIFHGTRPFASGDSFIIWDDLPGVGVHLLRHHPGADPRHHLVRQTLVLTPGQIVAVGDHDDASRGGPDVLAVVGGTGTYEGAASTLTSRGGRRAASFITVRLR